MKRIFCLLISCMLFAAPPAKALDANQEIRDNDYRLPAQFEEALLKIKGDETMAVSKESQQRINDLYMRFISYGQLARDNGYQADRRTYADLEKIFQLLKAGTSATLSKRDHMRAGFQSWAVTLYIGDHSREFRYVELGAIAGHLLNAIGKVGMENQTHKQEPGAAPSKAETAPKGDERGADAQELLP